MIKLQKKRFWIAYGRVGFYGLYPGRWTDKQRIWIWTNGRERITGIVLPTHHSYVVILMVNMMVFGDETSGRCLGHECVSFTNKTSDLLKGSPTTSLVLLPCEDTVRRYSLWTRKRDLIATESAGAPIVAFPISRAIRNIYKLTSLWYFVTEAQTDWGLGRGEMWKGGLSYRSFPI